MDENPEYWIVPKFHPDLGVDSETCLQMLRECSRQLYKTVPDITIRMIVDAVEGLLYCEIQLDGRNLGELYCVEALDSNFLRYGFFTTESRTREELEFYSEAVEGICVIVAQLRQGADLQTS